MQQVRFHYADRKLPLKNKTLVKSFIPSIFISEKKGLNYVDYIFCSDEFLLRLNKEQLNHNYYTDILTFDLSSTKDTEAEIFISVDRVKDNAKTFQEKLERETLRVIFHGILHLCGYKDKTKKEIIEMRKKEEYYIDRYYRSIVPRGTK